MGGEGNQAPPGGLEGRGGLKILSAPAPAAGADWILTPEPSARWHVLGGSAKLVTSAVANTRQVYLQVLREGQEIFRCPALSGQATGLTYTYQLLPGLVESTLVGTFPVVPLPVSLVIDNRMRLQTITSLLDVGDQWSNIFLLVEEMGPTY